MGKHVCPVCGKTVFSEKGSYEICLICGWEDDPVQERDPEFAGGANKMSLLEAREAYQKNSDGVVAGYDANGSKDFF